MTSMIAKFPLVGYAPDCFQEFSYAHSGMILWLLVAELKSTTGKSLSALVGERIAKYPTSGEINRDLSDPKMALQTLHDRSSSEAISVDGYIS